LYFFSSLKSFEIRVYFVCCAVVTLRSSLMRRLNGLASWPERVGLAKHTQDIKRTTRHTHS